MPEKAPLIESKNSAPLLVAKFVQAGRSVKEGVHRDLMEKVADAIAKRVQGGV